MANSTTITDENTFVQMAQLRARYHVSHMWVERRLADDPTFPKPMYIAKRRFWRQADIVTWERSQAANAGA